VHRRELLLDRRRRDLKLQLLYINGDIVRPDCRRRLAVIVAPREKPVAGSGIGPARVRVADIDGDKFDVAPGGFFAEIGDQRRDERSAPAAQARPGIHLSSRVTTWRCRAIDRVRTGAGTASRLPE
jgi:hypothetical protein